MIVRRIQAVTQISKKLMVRNVTSLCGKQSLSEYLIQRIKATGPITVAEYMKTSLLHPLQGYYVQQVAIGEKGDFITSPELTQMFGELIGIWIVIQWQKLGRPQPFQLVELGPGRGTMMADILKTFKKLEVGDVTVSFVEMSPHMREVQNETLQTVESGMKIQWYSHIDEVPQVFSCILANEFFDALPIHKLERTKAGWREVLIDIDSGNPGRFRYVLSPTSTAACSVLLTDEEKRDKLEVSAESGVMIKKIASRLEEDGGFALIIDYGHMGTKMDTFRAYKDHKLHDPLTDPGMADLTADVDFLYLLNCAKPQAIPVGPVSQSFFLSQMGISTRLQVLLSSCKADQRDKLLGSFDMLMSGKEMGERFLCLGLFPAVLKEYIDKVPVVGFVKPP